MLNITLNYVWGHQSKKQTVLSFIGKGPIIFHDDIGHARSHISSNASTNVQGSRAELDARLITELV